MTVDVITVATMSMFSLLSGAVVCTMPTEQDEVKKRYDDILRLLGKEEELELVEAVDSYFPKYAEGKWPWAMSEEEYNEFLRTRIIPGLQPDYDKELCVATMTAILANEEIETKYRISRVKPKLYTRQLLPF